MKSRGSMDGEGAEYRLSADDRDWPVLTGGMPEVKVLCIPKSGANANECEDAYAYQRLASGGIAAVSDGVSSLPESRLWAGMLVDEFVKTPFFDENENEILDRIDVLSQKWNESISNPEHNRIRTHWARLGSGATLIGLQFTVSSRGTGGTWRCFAVGDSCMMHISGGSLVTSVPKMRVDEIDGIPRLITTHRHRNERVITRNVMTEGVWREDDQFFLMTDAVTNWFLRQHGAGGRPWEVLSESDDQDLRSLVQRSRANGQMVNDDVTILELGFANTGGAGTGRSPRAALGTVRLTGADLGNWPARSGSGGDRPAQDMSPAEHAGLETASSAGSVSASHAFICYVREDSAEVDALQRALEAAGVKVWRDTSDLWPGEDWRVRIRDAISRNALAFIACFSRHGLARDESYQNEELALAIDQLRRRRPDLPWLIPVRFDDCAIPDVDIGAGRTLASLNCSDIFGDNRDQATARVVQAVARMFGPGLTGVAARTSSDRQSSGRPAHASAPAAVHTGEQNPGVRYGQRSASAASDLDALYLRAIEQLGSEQAPVRLGGLHGLARLGQGNPSLRQTVIEVICAYLRMPYRRPGESPASDPEDHASLRKEFQVRLTAQRILAEHLRDATSERGRGHGVPPETFWPEIDLIDLTGAYLADFNLSRCRVRALQCHRATFAGESLFRALRCDLAFFQGSAFNGHTDFRGAVFTNSAWFSYATFASNVWFHGDEFYPPARFGRHAGFKNVTFTGLAKFQQAVFEGSVDFDDVTCSHDQNAINMQGCQVMRPNAVNPDVSRAPSSWPPGWGIELGHDGTATITRSS